MLMNVERIVFAVFFMVGVFCYSSDVDAGSNDLSRVDHRLELEHNVGENKFAILSHKPNYILPVSYNSRPNHVPWKNFGAGATPIKKTEIKFQVSMKVPLIEDLFMEDDVLFAGYTQKSFWQAYSGAISAPFRDNNFNPELFYRTNIDESFLGLQARILTLGIEHESNGRTNTWSRSWNRIYGTVVAERGDLVLGIKAWYRIPENAATDDNSDITRYLGYGELYAYYHYREHVFGMMLRPSLLAGFNPGLQLDWSFPLLGNLQGYVQYYRGYGESLIDYNHSNNRLSVGVLISNWL